MNAKLPWKVTPDASNPAHTCIWSADGVRVAVLGAADWDLRNAQVIVDSVNACAAVQAEFRATDHMPGSVLAAWTAGLKAVIVGG